MALRPATMTPNTRDAPRPNVDPRSATMSRGAVQLRAFPVSKVTLIRSLLDAGLAEVALHGYSHLALSPMREQQEFAVVTDRGDRRLPERLIHATEAAAKLGVDVSTLQRWHAHHGGPPVAPSATGKLAYWSSELERWQDQLGGLAGAWR